MLTQSELNDLDHIFRHLKDAEEHHAKDTERLYICDHEPIYSPITVGEIRKLIAMAKRLKNVTHL